MNINELKLSPKRKLIAEQLNFRDSFDILSYYPLRYEEYTFSHFNDWKLGDVVTFECELISYPSTYRYGKRSTTRFKVLFEDNELLITIFNRPWIRDININEKIVIIGKYEEINKVVASNYYKKDINEVLGITPIYSLKESFKQNEIRKLISYTLEKCENELIDELPSNFIQSHGLISYKEAINNIHNPVNRELFHKAISRLKYEEFLRFYVALNILNASDKPIKKVKEFDRNKINELINNLPFKLTIDQNKAIEDILKDLNSSKIMNRLLQGDVGSGKTVVALIALYANYLAGYRGCLMAPTEILAKQHYEELSTYLKPLGVNITVLYSSMDNLNIVKEEIKNDQYDVIVGTHALFSEDTTINNLGLVITDEQHRFGVKQRRKLIDKGEDVDFLMMSATPIPRTLASCIYGDKDISTIEVLPEGRKGCVTKLIKKNSVVDILEEIKNKLKEGRQVYIVAAAIEQSENYNAKDVTNLFSSLSDALSPYKLGLMHGKLSSEEKDEVMNKFNKNEIQVLVSTTVVEVGVNVKNATMMIIYDADKFGLSQLHQLRGRVQRSNYEGTCYLLTGSKEASVLNRLEVLVNSNDGFKISYEDLKQRGPGDILGTRQSGLPSFILGNFIEDSKFIEGAKKDALEITTHLDNQEYKKYYEKIAKSQENNPVD